jgi:hypothetical protein
LLRSLSSLPRIPISLFLFFADPFLPFRIVIPHPSSKYSNSK